MTNPDNVGGLQSATKLRMMIGQYWDIAYAEGREGRQTDNEAGDAARVALEIEQTIGELCRAAPAGGDVLALVAQARREYRDSDAAGDVMDWLEEQASAPAGSGDVELGGWLWGKLMDFCKGRRFHPAEFNDLFAIVSELRALLRKLQQGAE